MTTTAPLLRMALSMAVATLLALSPARAQSFGPAVIVNDTIITNFDVDQRARMMAAAGGGGSASAMNGPALEALIGDALKISAAAREDITVNAADIEAGLAEIARQNGSSPGELVSYFQSRGVSREAIEAQVRAEVAWRSYVQRKFTGRAIGEAEVDAAVARGLGQDSASAPQYALKQIVVGVSPNALQNQADAALSLARAAQARVRTSADACTGIDSFLAENRGQTAYLPISGDIGSMRLDQMPGPVRTAVGGLSAGMASEPVRSNDGFHIIGVCNITGGGGVDRDKAREAIIDERLTRYSRSLLQDLRRQAVIERR